MTNTIRHDTEATPEEMHKALFAAIMQGELVYLKHNDRELYIPMPAFKSINRMSDEQADRWLNKIPATLEDCTERTNKALRGELNGIDS